MPSPSHQCCTPASNVSSTQSRREYAVRSSIAALLQKGAFALMAILLAKSGGDFTLPYMVFVGIDILGMILLLCVTNKCKGKQD